FRPRCAPFSVTHMPDQDAVAALIERIVAGAQIPGRARRDDLRRELSAHFEDAAARGAAIGETLRRFGPEAPVVESLRRAYRYDRMFVHVARIAASMTAAAAAAIAIQFVVSLR